MAAREGSQSVDAEVLSAYIYMNSSAGVGPSEAAGEAHRPANRSINQLRSLVGCGRDFPLFAV